MVAELGVGYNLEYYHRTIYLIGAVAAVQMTEGNPIKKGFSTSAQVAGLLALSLLVVLGLFFSRAQVQPGHYQAENLPRTTGSVVLNLHAAFGREVCGKPGQPGALIYGPYDWYEPGEYKTSFYLSTEAAPNTVLGRVEVSDAGTGVILATRDIINAEPEVRSVYQLLFSLGQASQLEFRVWYYGVDRLCVDQVITQLTPDK